MIFKKEFNNTEITLIASIQKKLFEVIFFDEIKKNYHNSNYIFINKDSELSSKLSKACEYSNPKVKDFFIFEILDKKLDSFYSTINLNASRILVNDSQNLERVIGERNPLIQIDLYISDLSDIVNEWFDKARSRGMDVPSNVDISAKKYLIMSKEGILKCINDDLFELKLKIPYIDGEVIDLLVETIKTSKELFVKGDGEINESKDFII